MGPIFAGLEAIVNRLLHVLDMVSLTPSQHFSWEMTVSQTVFGGWLVVEGS